MAGNRKVRIWLAAGICFIGVALVVGYGVVDSRSTPRKVEEDKASLRAIAQALEEYGVLFNVSPDTLEELKFHQVFDHPITMHEWCGLFKEGGPLITEIGPILREVPLSAFPNHAYPRYWRGHFGIVWMVWYPGPDGKYDLDMTSHEKEAASWMGPLQQVPWLVDSMYDPTNGSRSGDLIQVRGLY
ncbi:MAG: hypothetical protein NTW86_24985 [Candidatus Sumerlaeota bacterium]|nr:hypothetical protein [Candidatus Sumerlaeota bacterium]